MLTELPWVSKMAFKSERQHPKECERNRETLRKELLDWVNEVWYTHKHPGLRSMQSTFLPKNH